jgi:hypothetical protein
MSEFKVGDLVLLKKGTDYYHQAPGVVGTIIERPHPKFPEWVRIRWEKPITDSDSCEDNYPETDILIATKLNKLLAGVDTEQ